MPKRSQVKLQRLRRKDTPGPSAKPLRGFSTAEAAKFLGIKEGYLRTLALEGKGAHPAAGSNGRRLYTAEQILELRHLLDQTARSGHRYLPHRRGNEHLQMIAVVNFKGGSCKTTTCANLAQYLALEGIRVLAVDLDPQASLTALCGYQPELDIGAYETLLGAMDYEGEAEAARRHHSQNQHSRARSRAGEYRARRNSSSSPPRLLGSGQDSAASYFTRLEDALAPVRDFYDVVMFDCPPQLGFLTIAALCAATAVLVTIHPQMLDLMSMSQFLHMMRSNLEQVQKAGAASALRLDALSHHAV